MITYTLKIVEKVKETEDSYTFRFKQPVFKKLIYISGQYLTLIIRINNKKYLRPYSLSSAPVIDNTLNITVKRVIHGIVSNHLIDMVKVDDLVEVLEPIGDFTYKFYNDNPDIYFWGAGSGITPLMSIIKSTLHNNKSKVILTYCNHDKKSTIFYDQLMQLQDRFKSRLRVNLFYTKEKAEGNYFGRISDEHVSEFVSKSSNVINTLHYICGPIELKEKIKLALNNYGISSSKILSEDFNHIVNEIDLKEVQTRYVEILKDDETFDLEVVKGKSILEAVLDLQIDVTYSCQTGNCNLCKAILLTGDIKTIGVNISNEKLNKDEILLCCSYPLTDNVRLKINP